MGLWGEIELAARLRQLAEWERRVCEWRVGMQDLLS